jgi:APA family basic amino acid/polyamine antiporter
MAMAGAELMSREAVEGGYYRWARRHLGGFWGFQAGAWSIMAVFLDNAIYPVLFARTMSFVVPGMGALDRWLVAMLVVLVLTWINLRGIELTAASTVVLNVFLVAPLIWFCVAAAFNVRFEPFQPFSVGGGDLGAELGVCLGLALWLYSGYIEISTAGEEIERPERNLPVGLLIVTPLAILSYSLPYIAALAVDGGWESWQAGELTRIGAELGGPLLGQWIFLAGLASQVVIFLAYLCWSSRIVWSMAADRYLPAWLSRLHPRYGTPHRVLLIYAAGYAVLVALPFEKLLVADMWVSGSYELLALATLVRQRRLEGAGASGEARVGGRFRVPGGRAGLVLVVALPTLTFAVFLALTAGDHLLLGVGALLCGPAAYGVARLLRRRAGASAPAAGG